MKKLMLLAVIAVAAVVLVGCTESPIDFRTRYPEYSEGLVVAVYRDYQGGGQNRLVYVEFSYPETTVALVLVDTIQDADNFYCGLAAAQTHNRWGYINKKGDWVIAPQYVLACSFDTLTRRVDAHLPDGGWVTLDTSGLQIGPTRYPRYY